MTRTANMDYLCVIREKNNKTYFETIDIPASTELVSTLEGMVDNTGVSVVDMQSRLDYAYPKKADREYMNYVSPHSYGDAYISGTNYPDAISLSQYNEELASHKTFLRESFAEEHKNLLKQQPAEYRRRLEEYVAEGMAKHVESLKKQYLRQAKRFIMAKNYTHTLNGVKSKPGIRMYSTDTLGWSDFKYQVTDDIRIQLGTNFGYGSASYFRLCMRYKGIDILPYSFVVKYYFAERRDIIRFTRMYNVAHDSWDVAFNFVEEAANTAAEDSEAFVQKYIIDEIHQMMYGLEKVLKDPHAYADKLAKKACLSTGYHYLTVRNMNSEEKSRYGAYPEEMSMVIKAEKITGALDFIENLTELSSTIPEISGSIDRIKEMPQEILPDVLDAINKLVSEIANLQEKKAKIERSLELLQAKAAPHVKRIDIIWELRKKKDENASRGSVVDDYKTKHPEYAELCEKIDETTNDLSKTMRELRLRDEFRSNLCDCAQRVQDAGLDPEKKVA